MKRLAITLVKLAVVAAIITFVVYRLHFAPVKVDGRAASLGPIVAEVMGTGTLEARVQATISPKISGLITQVLVDQGDRIAKGQLLAQLYDADLAQQVKVARAEVAVAKAGVERAAADIAAAEATAAQARASHARDADLTARDVVSQNILDVAVERRDVAEAQLKRSAMAKVEAERQVAKAEESLRYFEERLADTRITSPFDGLVLRRGREPGDIAVPGAEILRIISTEEMWVAAWVDETAMSSLRPGQPCRVVFRSEPAKSYAGVLTRMAPLADRETREFLVNVTVKELPKNWAVGQRAEVYIETGRRDSVLLAPLRALVWQKGKPGLYVRHNGRAQWREIALGLRSGGDAEVLKGLAPGEVVIWPRGPKAGLKDGQAVLAP